MKALIWKELRENFKWAPLPALAIFGLIALFGALPLMHPMAWFFVGLVAAAFGAALGFLQVYFESQGDKRSLLLHRPISRSRIFLSKAIAGVGLYLLALGIPFACVVGLSATPGHLPQPFSWPMALPLAADVLTGLVYYFAGMLTAQREARWYGSRCLGLAAGLCCSYLVWLLPEFWHALLAVVTLGGVVAVAAWGSFMTGGAYAPQPRLAKIALAVTFLAGLSALSFTGKYLIGARQGDTEYRYMLDSQGRGLVVHIHSNAIQSVTDLEGHVLELKGEWLEDYALKDLQVFLHDKFDGRSVTIRGVPDRGGETWDLSGPRTRSYRNAGRCLVEFLVQGREAWWYVPVQGRLVGYDKESKHFLGSFGPEGFCPPDEQPRDRFQGQLLSTHSSFYGSHTPDYLAFADVVYAVDIPKRTVRALYVPPTGETVLWATWWAGSGNPELRQSAVVTDKWARVLDKAGSQVFAAPWAYDPQRYHIKDIKRLEGPERYRIRYLPWWYLDLETLEALPEHAVDYDAAGREIARHSLPPRAQITGRWPPMTGTGAPPIRLAEPSYRQVLFGLVTSPAEAGVLVGTTRDLFADFRASQGAEMTLLYQFLAATTTFFIPGAGWNMRLDGGLVFGFTALMLLSAAACALVCFLLARRSSFTRLQCLGWSLCGLLFGATGLLLML
ncbi:MAG TPA: hypothetical protein VKD72_23415, partial [Gemmataceae bacterium]|nr:hypothetical protein [Gemmataceae bacterium]